jgi:hypothetical protein
LPFDLSAHNHEANRFRDVGTRGTDARGDIQLRYEIELGAC